MQAGLAVQMAMTHGVALMLLARTAKADQIPQFESASNSAVKLLRTFTLQAETLAKLQRGGEQVVKVVHVHPGGKAIVGNVLQSQDRSGGGVAFEIENQPHAKAELPASCTSDHAEVRCQNPQRTPVLLASGER